MARPRRKAARTLKGELLEHPQRFDFFQAVRLLRIIRSRDAKSACPNEIGGDSLPEQEYVFFKGEIGHQFPAAEIGEVRSNDLAGPTELTVKMMGLYGTAGVLPLHDSQRLINDRHQPGREKAFLDLFNHRAISLFYRAWAKSSIPLQYERTFGRCLDFDPEHSCEDFRLDDMSLSLLSLGGLGFKSLRGRLELADTVLAFFASHFSCQRKSASALSQMIHALFGVIAEIVQFVGQWLQLDEGNRSEMASPENKYGQNAQLGGGFVLGDRVWDVASKFRIVLGPLTYHQLLAFSPLGDRLKPLQQLIRTYVGPQFDFDVQLELLAAEIPGCDLSGQFAVGVNSWLCSRMPTENVFDAVYCQTTQ